LWSSTPNERNARYFTVSNINNVPTISASDTSYRQNAISLRCFKNLSDITPFLSPSISRSGWEIL
jgi:hypothetical protein